MQEVCLLHWAGRRGISCLPCQRQSARNFLWSVRKKTSRSPVYSHIVHLGSLPLAKIPPDSTKCEERIKKGEQKGKHSSQSKRKRMNAFENQCRCVGFCSSWTQIHVVSPAINILNLGPKTVYPGPHKLSIWLLRQRKAFMSNFAQKSRFEEFFFFLRKDWIYHETYFIKKLVKWTTFLPKPQKRQIPLLEKLAAPVEKIKVYAFGGRAGVDEIRGT